MPKRKITPPEPVWSAVLPRDLFRAIAARWDDMTLLRVMCASRALHADVCDVLRRRYPLTKACVDNVLATVGHRDVRRMAKKHTAGVESVVGAMRPSFGFGPTLANAVVKAAELGLALPLGDFDMLAALAAYMRSRNDETESFRRLREASLYPSGPKLTSMAWTVAKLMMAGDDLRLHVSARTDLYGESHQWRTMQRPVRVEREVPMDEWPGVSIDDLAFADVDKVASDMHRASEHHDSLHHMACRFDLVATGAWADDDVGRPHVPPVTLNAIESLCKGMPLRFTRVPCRELCDGATRAHWVVPLALADLMPDLALVRSVSLSIPINALPATCELHPRSLAPYVDRLRSTDGMALHQRLGWRKLR